MYKIPSPAEARVKGDEHLATERQIHMAEFSARLRARICCAMEMGRQEHATYWYPRTEGYCEGLDLVLREMRNTGWHVIYTSGWKNDFGTPELHLKWRSDRPFTWWERFCYAWKGNP